MQCVSKSWFTNRRRLRRGHVLTTSFCTHNFHTLIPLSTVVESVQSWGQVDSARLFSRCMSVTTHFLLKVSADVTTSAERIWRCFIRDMNTNNVGSGERTARLGSLCLHPPSGINYDDSVRALKVATSRFVSFWRRFLHKTSDVIALNCSQTALPKAPLSQTKPSPLCLH